MKWDSGCSLRQFLYTENTEKNAEGEDEWSVHKEEDGIVQEYVSGPYHLSRTAEGNYKLVHSQAFAPGQQAIKQINADQMTLRNLYEQAGRPIKRKEEHRVSISLHMDRSEYYKGAKEPEPEESPAPPKESPAVPKTIPAARTMAETKPPVPLRRSPSRSRSQSQRKRLLSALACTILWYAALYSGVCTRGTI